jgi:hypothetical protein
MSGSEVVFYYSPYCPHCVTSKGQAEETLQAIRSALPNVTVSKVDVSVHTDQARPVPSMLLKVEGQEDKPLNFRGIEPAAMAQQLGSYLKPEAEFEQRNAKKGRQPPKRRVSKRHRNKLLRRKIAKLIREGYPTPQAVAIALNMQKRGKLSTKEFEQGIATGEIALMEQLLSLNVNTDQ